ncbi:MAG: MBL fold metallo-hydrolase [Parvibaculum sp.]|uniref:MBL fold metallo-hydrolase n=1 Tax=Parvibaculum sp. TaxID=2024848 RepID=UPI0025F714EC|nr:MBL fold metallo-hydrolase [Parvibaculum sp.]MCE9649258.1 MBL fold metallo-hydrolase [Parvibaculum sp.]
MKLRATILGCGSSGGVPRIGGHWGACDPKEPRNRRRRCSLLIEQWADDPSQKTTVLVDTSPDMRDQLIDANVSWIDGVLYTHDHADQSHGIDDLRMVALNGRRRVDVWMDAPTAKTLTSRFDYCFEQLPGSGYPAILEAHRIKTFGEPIHIEGAGGIIEAIPFDQDHGGIRSLGFRFGPLAYSSDVVDLPESSFEMLDGVECWIVDALRYTPHPTHAHVERSLEWIARVNPCLGILTNLHVDLDYRRLSSELPENVEPAFDGMTIEFEI